MYKICYQYHNIIIICRVLELNKVYICNLPARPAFVIASKGFEPEDSSEVSSIEELTSSSFFLPKKYKAEEEKEVECDNVEEEDVNGNNCRDLEENEDDDEVGNDTPTGLKKALLHNADNNKAINTITNRAISIPIREYDLIINKLSSFYLFTSFSVTKSIHFTSLHFTSRTELALVNIMKD